MSIVRMLRRPAMGASDRKPYVASICMQREGWHSRAGGVNERRDSWSVAIARAARARFYAYMCTGAHACVWSTRCLRCIHAVNLRDRGYLPQIDKGDRLTYVCMCGGREASYMRWPVARPPPPPQGVVLLLVVQGLWCYRGCMGQAAAHDMPPTAC